jgi:hypothetical protein
MAKEQKNKPEEKADRELLEEINRKQDLLLACFGLGEKCQMSPRELEDWAEVEVHKYRDRQAKKNATKK